MLELAGFGGWWLWKWLGEESLLGNVGLGWRCQAWSFEIKVRVRV